MAIDIKLEANGADSIQIGSNTVAQVYLNGTALIDVNVPIAPNAPTNFTASDDEIEQITFTWDNSTVGDPTPTYNIYIALNGMIAENVTSPHTMAIEAGVENYFVRAINSAGFADSDGDGGTSLPLSDTPPIYLMTEDLVNDGGFDYLLNSAPSGSQFDGMLRTLADASWSPDVAHYPKDGTIELADTGSGAHKIYTQRVPKPGEIHTFIHYVTMGTAYKQYSLRIKEGNLADTYIGDESTPIALQHTDAEYIIDSNVMEIFEEPLSVFDAPEVLPIVHISFGERAHVQTPPTGWTINDIDDIADTSVQTLLAEDGTDSGATLQLTLVPSTEQADGDVLVTGNNSACISDYQMENYFKVWSSDGRRATQMTITLPPGTYDIKVLGSKDSGTTSIGDYTFNGVTKQMDSANNNTTCVDWLDFVVNTEAGYTFRVDQVSYFANLNGMTITRTV